MVVRHRHILHSRGLSMKVKEGLYVMKEVDKMTWEEIASHPNVKNLQGEAPYWKVVRAA